MEKIYFLDVTIREVEIDEHGIGKATGNRLEYANHMNKSGEVYDVLMSIAEDFDKITLGVK